MKRHFFFLLTFFASMCVSYSFEAASYKRKAVFMVSEAGQNALGSSSYSGAPVLLHISPETVPGFSYSLVREDGADIAFADDNGVQFPHEIDTWNPDGTSLVWVRLPSVSASTQFNFYFGNSTAKGVASGDTWDGYVGVWHLNDTNETDTAYSYGVYPNSTAIAGIDGNLASVSKADAEGIFGKSVCINDSGYKTGNYCYGGVWVPGTENLKMGDTFTISGWFKHGAYQLCWDHMFYKRTKANNTTSGENPYTGSFAIEHNSGNGTAVKPSLRGASNSAKVFTMGNDYDKWDWIVFVYNGTSVTVYENGVSKGTQTGITAVTDNDAPLVFGNNTEVAFGGLGDCAWGGWIDEVRLVDDVLDANRIAGEYLLMTNTEIFESSEAVIQDEAAIIWSDVPTVVWDGSAWRVSASAERGTGEVSIVVQDVATGEETTVLSSVTFTDGGTLDNVAVTLPGTGLYSLTVQGVTSLGAITKTVSEHHVYGGEITAVLISDADEDSMTAGTIRLSIASALSENLAIPVVVTGTAVAGQTYEEISSPVVLQAGSTSVDVAVTPIFCGQVMEDVTVTVTVLDSNVKGGATATVTIVNALVDRSTLYVSPTGSDDNDGYGLATAKATIAGAVSALDSALPSTIWVESGTYPQSETISITSPVTIRSISGNPEDVTISKASGNISLMMLNHAGARLLDLTISGGGGSNLSGGNVYIDTEGGVVEHCILVSGALSTYNARGGNVLMKAGVVTRCILRKGTANYAGGGGGAYLSGGRIESCLVYENYASTENSATPNGTNGGGIRLDGATAEAVNCTVFQNRGASSPGIYVTSGRAVNCVIVDNFVMDGTWGWANAAGSATMGSAFVSCMTDGRRSQPSASCYGAPFGFVDRKGRDYRLTAASSAVDAGADVTFYSNLDLDGNPRVSGNAVDAGCFELQQDGPMIGVAAMDEEVLVGEEVAFVASAFGGEVTGSYAWDFGDGSEIVYTAEPAATHTYATAATNSVTVTAMVGGVEVSYTAEGLVVSCPTDVYVDAANGEGASYPYATPETAAATVAEAVAVATDGTTIHCADGTYTIKSNIMLQKGIVLEGTSGNPEDVVLQATGSIRLLWLANEEAMVRHLTLKSGSVVQSLGANLLISQWGGSVSNCIITAGTANNYSADGGNVYMKMGHITHTIISDGIVDITGGGSKGGNVTMTGGLLEHSLITGGIDKTGGSSANIAAGVRISGGTLRNCTIAKNAGLTTGGVVASGGSVENCVIAGNTSVNLGGDYVAWAGDSALFANCVTDTEAPLNETCLAASADALYTDLGNGDFHLAAGAVAIDAGAALENPPAVDLDGNERVQGDGIDMGCYEYDTSSLSISFAASVNEGIAPTKVIFTASVSGVDALDSITYEWDFDGDGKVDATTQEPQITHIFETPGRYSIGLTVTDATLGIEASLVKEEAMHIVPQILYVDAASVSPTVPYNLREIAATNLQEAVDEAIDGCTILIASGLYEHTRLYTVQKNVTILGETGCPDDVLLKSKGTGGIHLNGEALLANVTITNGYSSGGQTAGVYFGAAGGTVSNCAIRLCRAENYSGAGSAVYSELSDKAFVTHTVIDGCTVSHANGGGSKSIVALSKGHIANSVIRNCKGVAVSTEPNAHIAVISLGATASMVNCTVVDNESLSNCFLSASNGAKIINTVFANNSMPAEDTEDSTHSGFSALDNMATVLDHCAVEDGVFTEAPNETVVMGTADQFFADWEARNLVPFLGGLLYNRGTEVDAPATDLAGKSRVFGSGIDIGAYENNLSSETVIIFR